MPEIMRTPDGWPIEAVRSVPTTWLRTTNGFPVRAVRLVTGTVPPEDVYTAGGYPVRPVRLVDAAGLYTASQATISTTPEDVYTPDGYPIHAVRIVSGSDGSLTSDGHPIEAVWLAGVMGSPVAAIDADATLWQSAVTTNGGTVSAGRLDLVSSFIIAEKAAGTWALIDDYYPFWGENAPQALTSLKQRRLGIANLSPTFTVDRGYAFSGTNYVDTGFIPASHTTMMTITSARLAAYERTDITGGVTFGAVNSGTIILRLICKSSTSAQVRLSTSTDGSFALTDSRGWFAGSRTGTAVSGWKTGVPILPAVTVAGGTTLPTLSIYAGGQNGTGGFASGRVCSIGFMAIGAPLSNAQEAAQYANVQAWANAVGANV